jgi:hypothetical protein
MTRLAALEMVVIFMLERSRIGAQKQHLVKDVEAGTTHRDE